MIGGFKENVVCQICGKKKKMSEVVPGALVETPMVNILREKYPEWSHDGYICLKDLNRLRSDYIQIKTESEKGELTSLEQEVLKSLGKQKLLSKNINEEFERKLTLGEKIADKIAVFGGSWGFIISFLMVMLSWVIFNTSALFREHFDPYPFILLNLVLSCVAAIQAPIIMMSQNRQEEKDHMIAEHDYRINLKAELEIRQLHEKIDFMIMHQWQKLIEIQQVQLELLEDLIRAKDLSDEDT